MHDKAGSPRVFYGWWVVVASVLIYATLLGSHQSFAVFFKPISTEFGWSRTVTATAFLVGGLMIAALSPVVGTLSDRYGPRRVILVIALISATGYLLLSRVQTLWQFYGSFILEAVGMSFWVPLQTTVSRWFTQRRGLALGLTGIGGGIGQAVYPPLAQFLISSFGWRNTYIILGAFLAIVAVSATRVLRGSPQENGLKPYGEQDNGNAANAAFSHAAPAFKLSEAIRTSAFWMILLATGFGSLTLQMVWVHLAAHATDPEIGASAVVAASLLSTIGWSNLAGKVVMGSVSDRIGPRATLAICYGMAGAAMLWLTMSREVWALYVFAVVLGFFYGGWIPMQAAIAGAVFGLGSMGAVLGSMQTGTATAAATGAMVGGYIYDATGSYYTAFVLGGGLFFAAAALAVLVKKPRLQSDARCAHSHQP